MKTFSTSFKREDTVEFLIDDDTHMKWLETFKSSEERFFVVIDKEVQKEWGTSIFEKLKKHGKEIFVFEVKAEEHSKSLDFYPTIIDFLQKNRCNLSDLVIAIGGGIVIDLTSFTVSTYMRGLPFYTVPTTLIGMTDASTAGKTCLNTKEVKNILGTFYYPKVSYNNIHFLKTNTPYFLRQGYSEVFKYGLIGNKKLIDLLDKHGQTPDDDTLKEIIQETIETRIKIRKKHPLVSNLGHTFGHAIEKLSNHDVLHGDAISAGTVIALRYAQKKGLMKESVANEIIALMKKIKLNVYLQDFDIEKWVDLMMKDKKSSASNLHLVLIEDIEKPYSKELFYTVSPVEIKEFLADFMKTYPLKVKNLGETLRKELVYE